MEAPPENRGEVWLELNKKFSSNLASAIKEEPALSSRAEVQARAIPVVARILKEEPSLGEWQSLSLCMFDEVFADITCSIYLAACGLDRPAQTILRRALEIGLATVYLWDLPHVFWNWKEHDRDLNFNDMLEHFRDAGFTSLVRRQNPGFNATSLIDTQSARSLYRSLSNIVHGKMETFESLAPSRFQYNAEDWRAHLRQVCSVQQILFQLWQNRFECVSRRLPADFPQFRMQDREQ